MKPKRRKTDRPAALPRLAARVFAAATLSALLISCGPEKPAPADKKSSEKSETRPRDAARSLQRSGPYLVPVHFADLPGWASGKQAWVLGAWRTSCARLKTLPPERRLETKHTAGAAGSVRAWQATCRAAAAIPSGDHRAAARYFEKWFTPYRASPAPAATGQFTGYYEAEIRASRQRTARYRYPVYGAPPDLETVTQPDGSKKRGRRVGGRLVPYYARKAIETGAVARGWPVLMWADDPVDLFVLHVQGAARVRLRNGSATRLGYAADNGHRFVAIGRLMIDRGLLKPGQADMRAIRFWLKAHPKQARTLMAENPRYIFFRELPNGKAGPLGAAGVPLTAGRSLAVDPSYVPYHAPVWLATTWPGGTAKLTRLVIAQDTGGAIRGPVRGDLYWGTGEAALRFAGRMNQQGAFFLLLPRR